MQLTYKGARESEGSASVTSACIPPPPPPPPIGIVKNVPPTPINIQLFTPLMYWVGCFQKGTALRAHTLRPIN